MKAGRRGTQHMTAIYADTKLYVNTVEGSVSFTDDDYNVIKYWWEANPDRLIVEYDQSRTEFPTSAVVQVKAT